MALVHDTNVQSCGMSAALENLRKRLSSLGVTDNDVFSRIDALEERRLKYNKILDTYYLKAKEEGK